MKRFQFVRYPVVAWRVGFWRGNNDTFSRVFLWQLQIGPLVVRRWNPSWARKEFDL